MTRTLAAVAGLSAGIVATPFACGGSTSSVPTGGTGQACYGKAGRCK